MLFLFQLFKNVEAIASGWPKAKTINKRNLKQNKGYKK